MQSKELSIYGYNSLLCEFPSLSVLALIDRGFRSRFMPLVQLKKCRSPHESQSEDSSRLLGISDGKLQKVAPKLKDITSVFEFLVRLLRFCNGMRLVALNFPAPTDKWHGDPEAGVIRGVRYHWTSLTSTWFLIFGYPVRTNMRTATICWCATRSRFARRPSASILTSKPFWR